MSALGCRYIVCNLPVFSDFYKLSTVEDRLQVVCKVMLEVNCNISVYSNDVRIFLALSRFSHSLISPLLESIPPSQNHQKSIPADI